MSDQTGDDDKEYKHLFLEAGKRVREARKRAGLTQAQLAEAVGLAQSYVHHIENYGANLSLKTLSRLATFFRLSIRDLIPDNEFDEISSSSVAELCTVLRKTEVMLRTVASQQIEWSAQVDELKAHIDEFDALRAKLERLAQPSSEE